MKWSGALLLALLLSPGSLFAACPEGVPTSEAAVVAGVLDGRAAEELDASELAEVIAGRAVVRRMCVPGFTNPRYRVYRAVRATPETVATILSDPAGFASRLPLTFGSREVSLPPADPAHGRSDVAVHAVRMRYFLVPPWVAEDYTLRFVAGPYFRGGDGGGTTLPGTQYDSFAFKWTRLDSRIATHLDGSARFEPLAPGLLLLRYDTFLSFSPPASDARFSRYPPGVEAAIRQVVSRIDRYAERAQRVLDADPPLVDGPRRRLRRRLDGLADALRTTAAKVGSFPVDDIDLLGFGKVSEIGD